MGRLLEDVYDDDVFELTWVQSDFVYATLLFLRSVKSLVWMVNSFFKRGGEMAGISKNC